MAKSIPASVPPVEVLLEFLRLLRETVSGSRLVPVLRGSLLLRHCFGDEARPAADIDLECFERPRLQPLTAEEMRYIGPGRGDYGEFESLVDYGKAICRYAAESTQYYRWDRSASRPAVEFQETEVPEDGSSLWTYGTPGQRYYVGWARGRQSGRLHIDIAEAGSYDLADIGVADVELTVHWQGSLPGQPFHFPAYTAEMLLAAKLSWLLRSFKWQQCPGDTGPPEWSGEPKDLFDAHLLLTKGKLRANLFEKSLMAVGAEDKLDWNNLTALFKWVPALRDADFPNWDGFCQQHQSILNRGPAEMMLTVMECLKPLLRDFRQHIPFLLAINDEPADEAPYLIYADWLEEKGDPRGNCLRLCTMLFFRQDELSPQKQDETRRAFLASLETTVTPWLYQVFGGAERFRQIMKRIEVVN
jgi:uncharacterized protein (TIGR02996 family)